MSQCEQSCMICLSTWVGMGWSYSCIQCQSSSHERWFTRTGDLIKTVLLTCDNLTQSTFVWQFEVGWIGMMMRTSKGGGWERGCAHNDSASRIWLRVCLTDPRWKIYWMSPSSILLIELTNNFLQTTKRVHPMKGDYLKSRSGELMLEGVV